MSECLCLLPSGQLFRYDIPEGHYRYNFAFQKDVPFTMRDVNDYISECTHERITLHEITMQGFPGYTRAFVPDDMDPRLGWEAIFRAMYDNVSTRPPRYHGEEGRW